MTTGKSILLYNTLAVVFVFFSSLVLIKGQFFLIPLTTAGILTLLTLPLSHRLEKFLKSRSICAFISTTLLFFVSICFLVLISFQITQITGEWGKIKETFKPKMEQVKDLITEYIPGAENSIEIEEDSISMENRNMESSTWKPILFSVKNIDLLGKYLLTFIYIFFIITFRRHFKNFLLQLFPKEKGEEVNIIIHRVAKVAQKYLLGKIILIGILAVLYSVGLGFSKVDNFIIISILAATLSLIPYIGNIIGFGIALVFGYLSSGEPGVLIGVVITFSIAQFVESYILEPYIVGEKVDLHPFFVILVVVIGNFLWGIMGMILAIPALAILNVILLDISNLQPIGYLLSNKPPSEKL